jgi:hypothetical protein
MILPLVGRAAAHAEEPPAFVGAQACAGCHTAEFDAWKDSHHALAMQTANAATVLGDFAGVQFEHFGVTTSFFRDSDKFMVLPTVRTERCASIRSPIRSGSIRCSNT